MMATNDATAESLFLFDFDGVVCDSCDECTVSAWRTCQILNAMPTDHCHDKEDPPAWIFEKMRSIRPAIEVGWQIPVLLSVFLDQNANSGSHAMTASEIIENYEELVGRWLASHELQEQDMIDSFGKVRDDWIAEDLDSWLDINAFYEGMAESINHCRGDAVLVTTKQQRFAQALVRHAGVNESAMQDDSIFGLGMYKSKSDVIAEKMKEGDYQADQTYFFEDRWPTLAKCLKDERLEGVRFYLCSWGYCTEHELELAKNEPRVQVLRLADFDGVVR